MVALWFLMSRTSIANKPYIYICDFTVGVRAPCLPLDPHMIYSYAELDVLSLTEQQCSSSLFASLSLCLVHSIFGKK